MCQRPKNIPIWIDFTLLTVNGQIIFDTQLSFFDGEDTEVCKVETERKPYKIEITHVDDLNGDGAVDLTDVELLLWSVDGKSTLLDGDGDFRSQECIELLKEANIVVTNPPFPLFREYVALLVKHKKQFLIIGNVNALHYTIFPKYRKEIKGLDWGRLYYEHKADVLDPAALEQRIVTLMQDDEVTAKKGIYEYLLTGKENFLSIRTFTDS